MHTTLWLRTRFSIFEYYANPLTYFDSASTAQKPLIVLEVFKFVHFCVCANLNRGRYFLSSKLGFVYEQARKLVCSHLGADLSYECVVYKSATEALSCACFGLSLRPSFKVVTCVSEHHSGLVPWLVAKKRSSCLAIGVVGLHCDHIPSVEQYLKLVSSSTSLVLISHASNVLGVLAPIKLYNNVSSAHGAMSLVDGAQSLPHTKLNLKRYNSTEYVLAAHKFYGPAGIGLGLGKRSFWLALNPVVVGGGGVNSVSLYPQAYVLAGLPSRHESGSPMAFGLICLGALLRWRSKLGFDHEHHVFRYLWLSLCRLEHVNVLTRCLPSTRILGFDLKLVQADDASAFLNKISVCIRSGSHCAMPLLAYLGKRSICRASLALYNTCKDVDALAFGLKYLCELSAG
ncbi:aminotransferase class V-fold PLP-dependent enzyme [Candidatus Hodgkinia cicadicola]